jgi:hypothetical protein
VTGGDRDTGIVTGTTVTSNPGPPQWQRPRRRFVNGPRAGSGLAARVTDLDPHPVLAAGAAPAAVPEPEPETARPAPAAAGGQPRRRRAAAAAAAAAASAPMRGLPVISLSKSRNVKE